jgi:hypothetical protein
LEIPATRQIDAMNPGDPRPASIVLLRLHDEAPMDHFTLGWLMGSLHKRSFGIITLLLAVVAIAPGVSIVAGLLLMIPAFQMIVGRPAPVFPPPHRRPSLADAAPGRLGAASSANLRYLEKVGGRAALPTSS